MADELVQSTRDLFERLRASAGQVDPVDGADDHRRCRGQHRCRLFTTPALAHPGNRRDDSRPVLVDQCTDRRPLEVPRHDQFRRRRRHRPQGKHQLDLPRDIELQVERLDLAPQRLRVQDLTGCIPRAGHLCRRGARFLAQLQDEGGSHPVHQPIDQLRGDDVPLQRMRRHQGTTRVAQVAREVAFQQVANIAAVGQIGGQNGLLEGDLGIGHENGDFGRGEAAFLLAALGEALVVGQELDCAVQGAARLERAHQPCVCRQQLGGGRHFECDRLRLLVVVGQHQGRHLVGHRRQQCVALPAGHFPAGDQPGEQDLDVDLMVRAVDTGRIVDRVSVDAAAVEGELDATLLGEPEVAALADDARPQLAGIDAQDVVAAVVRFLVALAAGLDIGPDAAVVEQIDRCLQEVADQLGRGHLAGVRCQPGLHLG
ncbi:MAG: hypothetical protein AW12_00216 [Candidatus Accumulibacter sp. BA-94]|nr:MAG: hypothetical protein AW12_00216 [Candidatus Accumulibacter sp. BA-94]